MSVTTTNNLIIPEVVSSLIDGSLGDGVTLLPLAEQDDTLVGQPGDTLKFPVFSYIGKAGRGGRERPDHPRPAHRQHEVRHRAQVCQGHLHQR